MLAEALGPPRAGRVGDGGPSDDCGGGKERNEGDADDGGQGRGVAARGTAVRKDPA